jgi:DNA-binding NtrC family response regulator
VLELGGYAVDCAASAAEAVGMMEESVYELVLSDMHLESPKAGLKVLAHARMMDYKPATALVTSQRNNQYLDRSSVLIKPEDIPDLLSKVAELIGIRASRRVQREMRLAGTT